MIHLKDPMFRFVFTPTNLLLFIYFIVSTPQPMPSEMLCNQLTLMSQALQQAVRIINSKDIHSEQGVLAKKTSTDYQNHQRGDHRQVLQRKQMIEARKEFIENTQKEKVHECGIALIGQKDRYGFLSKRLGVVIVHYNLTHNRLLQKL